ncbi:methyltransferase [Bradyrhizobium sp. LHD-71]|uniref:class I SAM-dependent RNA methyltransferase n=1 Tax=Bradyrhizobium sp. LHD-71 TaxID=3072141 RepID=UPI00280EF413|nr:methyltransferase [Bradyrhizobium sp. LHD-71]MDQ8731990.1 methyltransferase [Bradyrhizobium sp. LHD-71]
MDHDHRNRLVIDHVGHRGDGVANAAAAHVFVPFTLPGETVDVDPVEGHADRSRLRRVVAPSAERIEPFCPHFTVCGGCAIQHWRADGYRAWKRSIVVETLERAGIACDVGELEDAHGNGRRRMVVHARKSQRGILKVGFAAAGSHDIVPIDRCPILAPGLDGALVAAETIAEALAATAKPLDIQLTATANGLDVDVRGSGPLIATATAALARISAQHRLARLTRHGEIVAQLKSPVIAIGPAQVILPPGSFLQATQAGEEALAAHVTSFCGKAKRVADLFCGVGPFTLRLAQTAQVSAHDSEAGAIEALRKAAQTTKGLKPVKAEARDLFRRPLLPQELNAFDAVVFDPPRAGALAQAQQLAASRVPLIVAVSCNVATFARDAKILIDGGYRISRITPIDQFRHTPHVELVAQFSRR